MRSLILYVALIAFAVPQTAMAETSCTLIVGANVQQEDGTLAPAELLLVGDRIREVGSSIQGAASCTKVEASGRVVTPGLIHPFTHVGLVEVELEAYSVDSKGGLGPDQVNASFVVSDAYNPQASAVAVSVLGGVTSAVIVPEGGGVFGQSGWVDLFGETQAQTVKKRRLAMHARIGGSKGSRATPLHRLRLLFDEARLFAKHRSDWEKNKYREFRFPTGELTAIAEVLVQRQPLVLVANRASDIEAALLLARDYGVKLILIGAAEGWRHAEALASQGVVAVVDPILNGPEGFDMLGARADNAAILDRAGVSVVFMTSGFGSHNLRRLRQVAGNAVRAGVPHAVALNAITKGPAAAYGMSDYGRLVPGAVANIVVWSGDPLEISSQPEHVFIGGQSVPLVSRQTRLRDRYRTLPGSPAPALPLP